MILCYDSSVNLSQPMIRRIIFLCRIFRFTRSIWSVGNDDEAKSRVGDTQASKTNKAVRRYLAHESNKNSLSRWLNELETTDFRKILASGIQSISTQNWNKILKLLPGLNQHTNLGDKIHKGANALNAKTIFELYHKLCSHWQNQPFGTATQETSIKKSKRKLGHAPSRAC